MTWSGWWTPPAVVVEAPFVCALEGEDEPYELERATGASRANHELRSRKIAATMPIVRTDAPQCGILSSIGLRSDCQCAPVRPYGDADVPLGQHLAATILKASFSSNDW